MFLGKLLPEICKIFIGEHPRQNVISARLLCKFIEITLPHVCYPENLRHIFRIPFLKNTSGGLDLIKRDTIFKSFTAFITVHKGLSTPID